MPGVQPTELVWAFVKNRVASRFHNKRTLMETREQLMDAFYGRIGSDSSALTSAEERLTKCEPSLVRKFIDKAHDFANDLIEEDDELHDSIDNLVQREEPTTEEAMLEEDFLDDYKKDDHGNSNECLDQADTFFAGINPLFDDEMKEKGLFFGDDDDPDC